MSSQSAATNPVASPPPATPHLASEPVASSPLSVSPTSRWKTGIVLLGLAASIAVSWSVSLAFGSESLPVARVWELVVAKLTGTPPPSKALDAIVWDIRAPRGLVAVIVGAGLAVAGVGMQTLVRNPLADPYLLGISAGAGVGATLVIMFGVFASLGIWALSLGALLGALGATLLVFGISLAQGGLTPLRLILTGVVLSAAFTSMSSFLVFVSGNKDAVRSVMFWLMGSVAGARWGYVAPTLAAVVVTMTILLSMHGWLDALAAGPDVARSLGVPVAQARMLLFMLLSLLVGIMVAAAGGIGFVGLIIPHMARIMVGARHRITLPTAALCGGLFLIWVDVASRVLVRPAELPLGVMTGVIGAPIFLFLLGRRHYTFSGGN